MHNIEYLTENDLPYFERKEALGEAIIIRIDPEVLLSLDLDELFCEKEKDQTLTADELEAFLHGKRGHAAPVMDKSVPGPENIPTTGIEENLQRINLSAHERQSLLQLIDSGVSDEELMEILQGQGS